jgi:hypothetical protein
LALKDAAIDERQPRLSRRHAASMSKIGQAGSLTSVPLLQGVRRNDFHAFDYHPFRRLAHFALCISLDRRVADLLQNVIAFDQFAERRVLPIESPNGCEADEELRTG